MLLKAQAEQYAVPAFNVHNLETIQAVVAAAVEMQSPLIIAATPSTMDYSGRAYIQAIAEIAAKENNIPIALHLDHHETIESIKESLTLGVKSVMIDGSAGTFEENVAITKEIVGEAHRYGATVEAELGRLGEQDGDSGHTDPDTARAFVEQTNVDSLAVAIGTGHGVYETKPNLDFDRLDEIRNKVDVPLVLHGASGISTDELQKCIVQGCTKVNISTEFKVPFSQTLRNFLNEHPEEMDIRKYMTPSKEIMREIAKEKIITCLSNGKA